MKRNTNCKKCHIFKQRSLQESQKQTLLTKNYRIYNFDNYGLDSKDTDHNILPLVYKLIEVTKNEAFRLQQEHNLKKSMWKTRL